MLNFNFAEISDPSGKVSDDTLRIVSEAFNEHLKRDVTFNREIDRILTEMANAIFFGI